MSHTGGAEYWGRSAAATGAVLFVVTAALAAAVPAGTVAFRAVGVTVAALVLFVAVPIWAWGRTHRRAS